MTQETVSEALSTVELRDKDGNLIDPRKIVVDPDWLDHLEHPNDAHPRADDGAAEGREAPLG